MPAQFIPFRPALHGPFVTRFHKFTKELADTQSPVNIVERIVGEEVKWSTDEQTNPEQRIIYRAAWLLFRDLVRVGWTFRWRAGIEVAPPESESGAFSPAEIKEVKRKARRIMEPARLEKLFDARDFVLRMENPSPNGIARVPIQCLIADSQALYTDLSRISALPNNDQRLVELSQVIKPYLQLVSTNENEGDDRCSETGHKLGDIWRYCRLTWATPAENTPGRTMLYLIRDAARLYHPVIAIGSLENTPFRINCRDNWLGWTPEAFVTEVQQCQTERKLRAAFKRLLNYVSIAVDDIDLKGLCRPAECNHPKDALLDRLIEIAARSDEAHGLALRAWRARDASEGDDQEDDQEERSKSELGNIDLATETALYTRKRAEQLYRLLTARRLLQSFLEKPRLTDQWPPFLASEQGQTAVRTALFAMKNRHIGTSILELNVCGAIPPYNELLAGKLAALLMISPQVVTDYRRRYGKRPSDIASRMKGETVVRPADLIYVGTSSLYRVGSSQYNRVKLPAGLLRPDAPEIKWHQLGETSGYGTLHISRLTMQCLEEASRDKGVDYVNHIFGEGPSPKMRAIRQALGTVMEPGFSGDLTKHSMSRLVYGVWLATNGPAIFRGDSKTPKYYFDPKESVEESTGKIIDFWRERWLLPRISQPDVLRRLKEFDIQTILVGQSIQEGEKNEIRFVSISKELPPMLNTPNSDSDRRRDFVRKLYRSSSSYADNTEEAVLQWIHIETNLDQEILKVVKAGASVVLTGNPGDGKTHLLRILAPKIQELASAPVVELDASAISGTTLKRRWAQAISDGKPFCVAINEAVLKSMADAYRDFGPLQEAQRQVEQAIVYQDLQERAGSVVVFDLSRRNLLAPNIIQGLIDKLTNTQFLNQCGRCSPENCDFVRNQKILRSERMRKRLQLLFDRVSRRGYHTTPRELQSFFSYLLFAGRTCDQLLQLSGGRQHALPQLPFSGKGGLFDAIRRTFDPISISHPLWDEALVYGETVPGDWLPDWLSEANEIDPGDTKQFAARKRAFFFCHSNGDELLNLATDDESEFGRFLEMAPRDSLRNLIRRINLFFGDDDTGSDGLRIWQSHRYNQSPRNILYSAEIRQRQDFEIVRPLLRPTMRSAFTLAIDHALLRLKNLPQVNLRIDFPLFELLSQAERGLPVLSLDSDITRRLWQFMENLTRAYQQDEARISLLDPVNREKLTVTVDTVDKRYLAITRGRNNHGH